MQLRPLVKRKQKDGLRDRGVLQAVLALYGFPVGLDVTAWHVKMPSLVASGGAGFNWLMKCVNDLKKRSCYVRFGLKYARKI